jgi:hypothetical protein
VKVPPLTVMVVAVISELPDRDPPLIVILNNAGVLEPTVGLLFEPELIITSSPATGRVKPDQLNGFVQVEEIKPFQVLVTANKLEFEMMAITIKIEILIEFFIVLYIYVFCLHLL